VNRYALRERVNAVGKNGVANGDGKGEEKSTESVPRAISLQWIVSSRLDSNG